MKRVLIIAVIMAAMFCLQSEAQQDTSVPPLINYQGMLTNANGNPMSGTKKLTFNIYDSATGTTVIWGPQVFDSVPLIGGRFNVILGSTDTSGRSITGAFSAKDRYLGIKVDSNTEIAPRQQILSAPFSLQSEHSAKALKADVAETVQGTDLYVNPNNGDVSISKNLTVNGSIQSEQKKPAFFVNVWSDDCNWSHSYLGCPEGYTPAGYWHIGGHGCDVAVRGTGYENGNICSGWMCLCVAK